MGGFIKTYPNLKLKSGTYVNPETGSIGPQGLNAGTTYYSSAVPCRGAAQVVLRFRSTDNNAPVSFTGLVCNDPTMTRALTAGASSNTTLAQPGAVPMSSDTRGLSVIIKPTNGSFLASDFAAAGITTHGTNPHTGVVVDADVYYNSDADITCALHGQAGLTVPA